MNAGAAITDALRSQKRRDLADRKLGYDLALLGGPADDHKIRLPLEGVGGCSIVLPVLGADGMYDARYSIDGMYVGDAT